MQNKGFHKLYCIGKILPHKNIRISKMTMLVLGASGKTGRLVVSQLLKEKQVVRVIVRSEKKFYESLPESVIQDNNLMITEASLLELPSVLLNDLIKDCHAVISCLGHNLTIKGMYGQPRRLVTESVKQLCQLINSDTPASKPIKFILMNTTGNQNKHMGEKISKSEEIVMILLRLLVPPHLDNEKASQYLQDNFIKGQSRIEWVIVRPDSLTDERLVTNYEIHDKPIRSAIFDAGITSRINVANFISTLASNEQVFNQWKYKMPVIYNADI